PPRVLRAASQVPDSDQPPSARADQVPSHLLAAFSADQVPCRMIRPSSSNSVHEPTAAFALFASACADHSPRNCRWPKVAIQLPWITARGSSLAATGADAARSTDQAHP